MLRGCLLSLLLLAAIVAGYAWWLGPLFPEANRWILGGIVGLIVFFCIGALTNAWQAWGDGSLLARARRGLPLDDGRMVAVCGAIRPIADPLLAPFSRAECVICEYDLARPQRYGSSDDGSKTGSDYAGFLMTPCKIESPVGDVRLLGFPMLEGFSEDHCLDAYSAANARKFLQETTFEDHIGMKIVTVLSVFGEVWSDDDGQVSKHLQISKATVDDIFPPEVTAEVATWTVDESADSEDEYLEDEDADDGELDESGHVYRPLPKMIEKRVSVGTPVCAIGVYDQARGGLVRRRGSTTANRLLRGSAEEVEKQLRGKLISHGLGGLIVLLLVHGAIFGALALQPAPPGDTRPAALEP